MEKSNYIPIDDSPDDNQKQQNNFDQKISLEKKSDSQQQHQEFYNQQPGQYGQIQQNQTISLEKESDNQLQKQQEQEYYYYQQQQQQQQYYDQQQQQQQQYYNQQQQQQQQQQQYIAQTAYGSPIDGISINSNGIIIVDPSIGIPNLVAQFDDNAENAEIIGDNIIIPESCVLYQNALGKGKLKIRLISASNLEIADIGGSSDPYVKIKSSCLKSFKATRVVHKNLNPVWEETLIVDIDNVKRELLMFDVYDHDLVGCDDLLGYTGIDVSKLPLGIEVIVNENLSFAKHGNLKIALTALDFGLTNIPRNYISTYCSWRMTLKGKTKKDFKHMKKDLKRFATKETGPYIGKATHPQDYKLVNGYVKRRKTKREKTADGLITGLKVVGVVALVAISS